MSNRVLAISVAAVAGLAASAIAQPDTNARWGSYKAGQLMQGSVDAANGPATSLEWTLNGVQPVAAGGITIGSDGMLYFQTRSSVEQPRVYKVNPANGNVLAVSPFLPGNTGTYASPAHAVNGLWTAVSNNANGPWESAIIRLNYSDLSIAQTITDPALDPNPNTAGLRGAPLIGTVNNQRGNVNLYVHMRGAGGFPGGLIHAVDSVTGDVDWSYDPLLGNTTFFGFIGPGWVSGGRYHIGHFGNQAVSGGIVVRDNADGTWTEVWFGGPDNFNWMGTAAMNDSNTTMYVTTFNDGDTPSMWAINAATGAQNWSVPGRRGTVHELNFFARPSVMGNRVYACGGAGVITAFDDNGGSYTQPWVLRPTAIPDPNNPDLFAAPTNTRAAWATEQDFFNAGEITAYTVVDVVGRGGATERLIYAVMQQQNQDPGLGSDPFTAQFIVVRDEGSSATELFRTTLNNTMIPTRFGNSTAAVDEDGNVYVAGGSPSATAGANGQVYKFAPAGAPPCPADRNGDGILDFFDVQNFLAAFSAQNPSADIIPDGIFDFFDVQAYLGLFSAGCP